MWPEILVRLRILCRERVADGLELGAGLFHRHAVSESSDREVPARLAWLTGFTGSAGTAVVLADKAARFVDGRYTLQAAAEVDGQAFAVVHSAETSVADWLAKSLPSGAKLGFDPWLHAPAKVERLKAACARAGATLLACDSNPLDAVWRDRPPPPTGPVTHYPTAFAGRRTSGISAFRVRAPTTMSAWPWRRSSSSSGRRATGYVPSASAMPRNSPALRRIPVLREAP